VAEEGLFVEMIYEAIHLQQRITHTSSIIGLFQKLKLQYRLHSLNRQIEIYRHTKANDYSGGADTLQSAVGNFWQNFMSVFDAGDTIRIRFLSLPDQVLVLFWGHGGYRFKVAPLSRIQLRAMVSDWHRSSQHVSKSRDRIPSKEAIASNRDATQAIAEKFAKSLLLDQILEEIPSSTKRLIFIPDDALCGFPFAALYIGNQYIGERYAIAVSYSRHFEVIKTFFNSKKKLRYL
jgi:CHAT domain-containing protein